MAIPRLCSIPGCNKNAKSRGWCIKHYRRWQRHGAPTAFIYENNTQEPYANRMPEYRAWGSMKDRCYNHRNKSFHNYGGRGITVCQRWLDSFDAFLEDMGRRPSAKHSLDRWPDKDGHYEAGNCRWALPSQQMNNVRYNRNIAIGEEVRTVAQWCRHFAIARSTFESRLDRGWSILEALTRPPVTP